ncbi:MAG: DNA-processing protein DprA [bacterium]
MTRVEEDWLALTLVKGVGQKTIRALLDRFGGIGPLLDAGASAISGAAGVSAELAARIADAREVQAFAMERRLIEQHGVRLLCLDDEDYPPLLRQIHVPPPILYCRGEVPLPEGLYLAVVGTRRQSRYGERAARRLIEQLASAVPDLVVVSGMARGADTTAHLRALEMGLKTVAVLAGGLTDVYPPENRELADRIAGQGTLLTEFHMNQPPLGKHFPIRNRIISGLSRGLLVTEAGEKSGALITAGFALNHGREVFAVPGNIDQPGHEGTNRLIQRGQAKLVRHASDILEELELAHPPRPVQLDWLEGSAPAARNVQYSEEQTRVLACLQEGPLHPDDLSEAAELPVEKLLGILLELELSGEICQTANNLYAIL